MGLTKSQAMLSGGAHCRGHGLKWRSSRERGAHRRCLGHRRARADGLIFGRRILLTPLPLSWSPLPLSYLSSYLLTIGGALDFQVGTLMRKLWKNLYQLTISVSDPVRQSPSHIFLVLPECFVRNSELSTTGTAWRIAFCYLKSAMSTFHPHRLHYPVAWILSKSLGIYHLKTSLPPRHISYMKRNQKLKGKKKYLNNRRSYINSHKML